MCVAKVGYVTGTFDLFHVGHLRLLQAAKALCEILIVGVQTDESAERHKGKPVIPFEQRIEIVRGLRIADVVIAQDDIDKVAAHDCLRFDALFAGDDKRGDSRWAQYEEGLSARGVKVIYFPYTTSVSTTDIIERIRAR